MEKTKKCACCGKELPVENFGKSTASIDGLYCYCKECARAKSRETYAHPDRKRELRDEATEREVAFCDAWFAENNQFPTFGHAIEWADRTMVERAICFIEDAVCDATIETGNMARLIENFKEAMGYNELKVEN